MSTEYMRNLIALMENSTSAKSKKSKNLFESDDLDPEFIAHVNSIAASHGSSNEMLDEDDEDFPGSSMHPIHDPSIDIDHPDFEKHINDYSNKTLAARAAKNQSSVPNHTFNGTHYVNNENPGIKVHPDDNSVSVHGMKVGQHKSLRDAAAASNHLSTHVRSVPFGHKGVTESRKRR